MKTKTPLSVVYRLGTPADYARALEIQSASYALKEVPLYGPNLPPLTETVEGLTEEIRAGKKLLVAEIDGRVVGSLRMELLDNGDAYFGRLSVDPELQGNGIGQRMVLAFEAQYPDAPGYVLTVGIDSLENQHIYGKLGYIDTGRREQIANGPYVLELRKPNPRLSQPK